MSGDFVGMLGCWSGLVRFLVGSASVGGVLECVRTVMGGRWWLMSGWGRVGERMLSGWWKIAEWLVEDC